MTDYCPHSGKVKHLSASDALKALKRLSRCGGPFGQPYLCPHCSGWHQTKASRQKNISRKIRQARRPDG